MAGAKVIAVAEAEVGYLEKASNMMLDDKTANAGYGNYTKYARDIDAIPNFYNGAKQSFMWCDCFVDWCFIKAYGVENAMKLLCQPYDSAGAGCSCSAQYYKDKGRFHTSNPQPGDQIFFQSGGCISHTGLVVSVSGGTVYTIEGNTSGSAGVVANGGGVFKKSYACSSSYIYGYGRPDYSIVGDCGASSSSAVATQTSNTSSSVKPVAPAVTSPVVSKKYGSEFSIKLNELSKGDFGPQVKALQQLLIENKYSVGTDGADGEFGNNTYLALVRYQNAKKLDVDGIAGLQVAKSLLRGE